MDKITEAKGKILQRAMPIDWLARFSGPLPLTRWQRLLVWLRLREAPPSPIPKQTGKTIVFRRFLPYGAMTEPGTTPSGTGMRAEDTFAGDGDGQDH